MGVGGCLIRFFGLACDVMSVCRATEGRIGLWFSVGVCGIARRNITKDQMFVFVRNGIPCFLACRFEFVPGSKIHAHHIDTPADELMVMLTDNTRFNGPSNQNRRPARMNLATWNKLKPASQKAWDTISDEDKRLILGYVAARQANNPNTKPKANPLNRVLSVNITISSSAGVSIWCSSTSYSS